MGLGDRTEEGTRPDRLGRRLRCLMFKVKVLKRCTISPDMAEQWMQERTPGDKTEKKRVS